MNKWICMYVCMRFRRKKERKWNDGASVEWPASGKSHPAKLRRNITFPNTSSFFFSFLFFSSFFSKLLFTLISKILYTTQHFLSSHVFLFFLFSIINYCIYIFSIHKVHQKILNLSSHFLTKLILILSHLH
jgi:hypothetical protein